jgi:hypothetical protein
MRSLLPGPGGNFPGPRSPLTPRRTTKGRGLNGYRGVAPFFAQHENCWAYSDCLRLPYAWSTFPFLGPLQIPDVRDRKWARIAYGRTEERKSPAGGIRKVPDVNCSAPKGEACQNKLGLTRRGLPDRERLRGLPGVQVQDLSWDVSGVSRGWKSGLQYETDSEGIPVHTRGEGRSLQGDDVTEPYGLTAGQDRR